jgi:anti-sigma B factor antagonist
MTPDNLQAVASDGARHGQRIIRLKGPLSLHTVFDFQGAVRSETSPHLIIDFSDVPFVDSSGLGALVGVQVSAQKSGRTLGFVGMNAQVVTLMEMTKIRALFQIYSTVQEAEAAAA